MIDIAGDVAVIGSGFAGSLTALLLSKIGLKPVLIDKLAHPRFAIGESTTPLANMVLADLARRYDLPRIAPLAKYGSWQRTYPDLVCGKKRGFSYFRHEAGEHFVPRNDHANELLVTASADDEHSDTHWLRADVDGFLAKAAVRAGVPLLDRTSLTEIRHDTHWELFGERLGEAVRIGAPFLIDAAGPSGVLARALRINDATSRLSTHSRAVFTHLKGLAKWHDLLMERGGCVEDHPFCSDDAAQHFILDGAWMWILRFNNEVTSVGFAIDGRRQAARTDESPAEEWSRWLARYPSLAALFAPSVLAEVPGCIIRTGRLQRMWGQSAGPNWVMLPHSAGFIDALQSTGMAQSLFGIERLVASFERHWGKSTFPAALAEYERAQQTELLLVDRIVHGCFESFRCFRLLTSALMLYFAAATTCEHRRAACGFDPAHWFLCADDAKFVGTVESVLRGLLRCLASGAHAQDIVQFEADLKRALAPYNHVGLCDESVRNMYRYTAAPV